MAAPPPDLFALLDLPPRYHLDKAALRQAFLLRSRALHPDVHAQASAPEQAAALQRSSELNAAYRTLADDEARLGYLLQRAGLLDASGHSGRQLPPDFLMEMLERNEALDTLRGQADAAGLQAAQAELDQLLHELEAAIDAQMRVHDAAGEDGAAGRQAALDAALTLHLQRKYVLRMLAGLRSFAA